MTSTNDNAWAEVAAAIGAIVAVRPNEYAARTIDNVRELMVLIRSHNLPVPRLGAGHWPTFSITWNALGAENLEIEVFADHLEVYRFFEGKTDIWDEPHSPGAPFSTRLLAELPRS